MEVLRADNGLTSDCGSHCGIQQVGTAPAMVGHCPCKRCHGRTGLGGIKTGEMVITKEDARALEDMVEQDGGDDGGREVGSGNERSA